MKIQGNETIGDTRMRSDKKKFLFTEKQIIPIVILGERGGGLLRLQSLTRGPGGGQCSGAPPDPPEAACGGEDPSAGAGASELGEVPRRPR